MSNNPLPSKGRLFVISAPSGTGKTTLVNILLKEIPALERVVTFTSRPPRTNEINGEDYHFVPSQKFEEMLADNLFLESALVYGHYYGTPLESVRRALERGRFVVLVIDTQGAMQVMRNKQLQEKTFIFIEPPSMEELKKRLLLRKTENRDELHTRLEAVKKEIESKEYYDYSLINTHLNETIQQLKQIMLSFQQ